MKFKVGIADQDKLYLERLVQWFSNHYPDKLEIFSFTNVDSFQTALASMQFDMILANSEMGIAKEDIPAKTGFAYLVAQNDIEMITDVPAIGKYQNAEMLYKQMIGLYANNDQVHIVKKNSAGNLCKVIVVTAANGGAGASTAAAALSKYLAKQDKKVLYLNLEKIESQSLFFDKKEGTANFSDMIYLLKSNKNNIALRMESLIQKDSSGVFFFQPCNNILDKMELDAESIKTLMKEICIFADYDYLVLDTEFAFEEISLFLAEYADTVLLVADGSKVGGEKLNSFSQTLQILDAQKELHILQKFEILYNRFGSKTGQQAQNIPFPILGGTPRYEGVSEKEISEQISSLAFWEKCL